MCPGNFWCCLGGLLTSGGRERISGISAAVRGALQLVPPAAATEPVAGNPIVLMEDVLCLVGRLSGTAAKPNITEAKRLLRLRPGLGGTGLAARVGRLSKGRNAIGHPDVELLRDIEHLFICSMESSTEPVSAAQFFIGESDTETNVCGHVDSQLPTPVREASPDSPFAQQSNSLMKSDGFVEDHGVGVSDLCDNCLELPGATRTAQLSQQSECDLSGGLPFDICPITSLSVIEDGLTLSPMNGADSLHPGAHKESPRSLTLALVGGAPGFAAAAAALVGGAPGYASPAVRGAAASYDECCGGDRHGCHSDDGTDMPNLDHLSMEEHLAWHVAELAKDRARLDSGAVG